MMHRTDGTDLLGYYRSPVGWLRTRVRGKAIAAIECVSTRPTNHTGFLLPRQIQKLFDGYFKGKPGSGSGRFELEGTPFQKRVWKELGSIPWGRCVSYAQLARAIGRPKAVRAVAGAVGKNPAAILVPCHRVIGSDGSLTGYAYGLRKKAWLIAHEKRYNLSSGKKRT